MNKIQFQADDFGYKDSVNNKIIDLYSRQKISSFATLADFLELTKNESVDEFLKNKEVNLHVNLVEGEKYSPLPFFVLRLLLGLVNFEAIKEDIQRQIDLLKKNNVKVSEINSHQHTHALYPIGEIFIDLANKNHIPYVRSYKDVSFQTLRAKLCFFLLKATSYLSFFRYKMRFGLSKTWNLQGIKTYYMSWEDKKFSMEKLLEDKQIEVVIHPGTDFDNNNNYEKYL